MRQRKGVLLLVLLMVVTSLFANGAYAGRVVDPKTERLGLLFTENMELTSMGSVIYGRSTQVDLDWRICKTVTDDVCTAATQLMIMQFFSLCEQPTDINCIEEVWAKDSTGTKIKGSYQGHFPAAGNTDFPAEPLMNLPASKGSSFIVKFPNATHAGKSDEYLVAVRNLNFLFKGAGEKATNQKIGSQGLVAGITPFELVAGNYRRTEILEGYGSNGGTRVTPDGVDCFATENGLCAAIKEFPKNYKFGMTLRLSQKLSGWFHGRITNPTISTKLESGVYTASIEASPVRVASLDFLTPTSSLSQEIKDLIFNGEEWGVSGDERGTRIVTGLEEDRAQTLLQLFTPHFEDKATRTSEYWTVKTLGDFRNDAVRRCTDGTGDLAGIVSTNALLYSAGPPTFNAEESSLDYKVSAPHYESNGDVASGTYDLLLRSDVARCIYGFTDAPIKASLEVVSSDGEVKVATTAINERNGWLTMSANGFGFSAPIVRAKLSQEKPQPVVTPTPTPTPSASSTAEATPTTLPLATKKTKSAITCIKGVQKKKVAGVKPKCPKGWKKA